MQTKPKSLPCPLGFSSLNARKKKLQYIHMNYIQDTIMIKFRHTNYYYYYYKIPS